MARPTDYTPEMLEKAKQYVSSLFSDHPEYYEAGVPSIARLAVHLEVSRDTLYEWAKTHEEFSYILDDLLAHQEDKLLFMGLNGKWNPTITKLMLSKHGYRESSDVTSGDKPVQQLLVRFLENGSEDSGHTE